MKTFPDYQPKFGLTPKYKFNTIVAQFGDGYSQRGREGINNREEEWSLTYELLDADAYAVADFIDEHVGSDSFLWTPPFKTEATYICTSYSGPTRIGQTHSSIKCKFERVYDL